jgi:GNAT superfamily N-acetyltransferase
VRDARPEDARDVAHVHTEAWRAAYAHAFPHEALTAISAARRAEFWRDVVERRAPRTHTLLATHSGRVVGFASLGPELDDEADREPRGELYAMYVIPHQWGFGIGQALMAEAVERLRSEGFGKAILWVLEDNPRARRYYELAGWRVDDSFREAELLGMSVREVRYQIALESSP